MKIVFVLAAMGMAFSFPTAAAAEYWVRGEAIIVIPGGAVVAPNCPAAGTRFSAIQNAPNKAACEAHGTCTAAKLQAVNNWVAQMNAGGRGACTPFVQQRMAPCSYNC